MRFFLAESQKIFEIWKFDGVFFRKKRFHLFKSLFYKYGKPENMPIVAGRLVCETVKLLKSLKLEKIQEMPSNHI